MRPGERREDLEDLEPLELEEWERVALLREALAQGSEAGLEADPGGGAEAWLLRHRGEGRFPAAQGAALEAAKLQDRWTSLRATLSPLGEERLPTLQWGDWQGTLPLRGEAVVLVHPARARARHRLDLWLRLQLAVAAMAEAPPRRGVLIARGSRDQPDSFAIQLTFQAPDPEAARQELARLWRLRQAWRQACWPVPPETGWSWVEQGGPAVGAANFAKVLAIWEGHAFGSPGEREREEMGICFGSQRSLEALMADLPFAEAAHGLLDPLFAAIDPLPPARP
jgi:exodeoxyribonuclease V gamma subunit